MTKNLLLYTQIYNYVFNNYLKYVNKNYEHNINHNHIKSNILVIFLYIIIIKN